MSQVMKHIHFFLCVTLITQAATCTKKEVGEMDVEKPDILFFEHKEFGGEQFQVGACNYNLYQSDDGAWEFVIEVSTTHELKRSSELEKVIHPKPHFEATAVLVSDDLELTKGRIITQVEGYDRTRQENLSNIYYFAHESVEDLRVEILEVAKDWIVAKVTGSALINGSNGTKPDAKLGVKTKFLLDSKLRRGVQ